MSIMIGQHRFSLRGFTLVEMVVVIAIAGVVAASVAMFIRQPVVSAMDTMRRAEYSDIADTALRRMARDIRRAVPNSVRVALVNGVYYLEFLQTRSGGRYRKAPDPSVTCAGADDSKAGCNSLDFTRADTSFEVLGGGVAVQSGDNVVIYNLGITGANAYNGDTRRAVNCVATPGCPGNVTSVALTSTAPFPLESPDARFLVVDTPVTYVCTPGANGTLTRYWGYGIALVQPTDVTAAPLANASQARLADRVTGCQFTYATGTEAQRHSLVTLRLTIGSPGGNGDAPASVSLYYAVQVSNVP